MKQTDLKYLYQNLSGTPVTEAGQPVALVLDKSLGLTLGSEKVTNGFFRSNINGWVSGSNTTFQVSDEILYLSSGELSQEVTVDPEKVYRLTANITAPLGGKALTFGSASSSEERSTISIPRETRKVFIALGQSNLDGFSVSLGDPEVPTEYFGSQPYCKSWQPQSLNSSSGSWTTLNTFLKHTVTRYDSAVYSLHRYSPISVPNYDLLLPLMKDIAEFETGPGRPEEPVYLIKNTHPSTFMVSGLDAPWNNLSWTDQSGPAANLQGSGLYFTLINDVSAAIEALRSSGQEESDIEIAGIFIMQGESESGSTYPAQTNYPNPEDIPGAWGQYFRLFYSNLQRDLKAILYGQGSSADDLPVYLARTHYFLNTGGNYAYTDIVREQQESVASDPTLNVTLVDIDEIDHFGDSAKVHFDGSGLTSVADRFFSEYFDDWNVKRNSFWASQEIALERHFIPETSSLYISLHRPVDEEAPIADLFANGEEGAWYDPSDFTTLFEDSFGRIPVTGAGQPVGLMLDKSKGLELGTEQVANGTFDSSTDWLLSDGWAISGNALVGTNAVQTRWARYTFPTALTAGFYKIEFDIVDYTSGDLRINILNAAGSYGPTMSGFSPGSRYSIIVNVTSASYFAFGSWYSAFTGIIDNISIRKLSGNHATQSTSTARPVLQESGGKYYLDFDGVDDYLDMPSCQSPSNPFSTALSFRVKSNSYLRYFTASLWSSQGWWVGFSVRWNGTAFEFGNLGLLQDFDPHVFVSIGIGSITSSTWYVDGNSAIETIGAMGAITHYDGTRTPQIAANGVGTANAPIEFYGGIFVDADKEANIEDIRYYLSTKSGVSGISAPELYPNTFDNISLREVAGFHAKQPTSTARPTLAQTGSYYYLDFDEVDDRLLVDVPGQVSGTAVISDVRGTAAYGVLLPSGTFSIGTNSSSVNYSFNDDLLGMLVRNVALDQSEIDTAFQYFREGGASAIGASAYQGVTDFNGYWRNADWITEFPLIDTTSATSFYAAWFQCTNLKSFPLLNTSNVTNLRNAFSTCTSLSSFPLIDTSQVTNVGYTWQNCISLSSFPLIDTGSVTNMELAWYACRSLSSFPLIDTSQVTNMQYAWRECLALTEFPLIDTSQVTTFNNTWNNCRNLSSFPHINTGNATNFYAAFGGLHNIVSFPPINTSKGTNFNYTWFQCLSLSSFPYIDVSKATSFSWTWRECPNLEVFPSGMFDNTSGTVDFSTAFLSTKLNSQSVDNILLSINNANTASGTLELSVGSMQAPGVGGTYAKHRLESRDWTVNTKPVSDDVIVSSIFYTGQYGTWYDVNDLDTLFEDSAGTIPVTGAGQPVGLMLDKSQGLVLGEEETINGTFDTDLSGWNYNPTYWFWENGRAYWPSGSVYYELAQLFSITGACKITVDYELLSAPETAQVVLVDKNNVVNAIYFTDPSGTIEVISPTGLSKLFFTRRTYNGTQFYVDNISVKELPGNHAYQNTSTARPVLQGSAGDYHLDYDQVDDRLLVDVSGFNGTAYIPTEEGSVAYGVAIPSGTYALGTNTTGVTYSFAKELVGGIITDTPMISAEIGALDNFFAARGAGPYGASAYGGLINLSYYWRDTDWITDFPLIDTSQVIQMNQTWQNCTNLSNFPAINTSATTSMQYTWQYCTSLSSFPLIDTGSAANMTNCWVGCNSLTSFPQIDTKSALTLRAAWYGCTSLSSFPLIDTLNVTSLWETWRGCNSLESFPAINTSSVLSLRSTWLDCNSLTSFPWIDTSQVVDQMYQTWANCNSLSSFPLIDTSQVTALLGTWGNCTSLTDFPAINTSAVTSFNDAWRFNYALSSFPLIDTSRATNFGDCWTSCTSLSSFPAINTSSAITLQNTWRFCTNLSSFPLIDTSQVINMAYTWYYCQSLSSFPQIDCQSVTSVQAAWVNCTSLEDFPAGVFDNTSGTTNFSYVFAGTKLNSQSVDNVIISINNANTSAGTLTLNSSNTGMQAPTASGLLAADYLYDRGWTLNLVGGYTPLNTRVSGITVSGAWLDMTSFDYLYEDSAGTIPTSATETPVGLVLDRSGNSYNLLQQTSTARPVVSGRYNLLKDSGDFDTTAWTTGGLVNFTSSLSATTAPDGTQSAALMTETASYGAHYISQAPANTVNERHTKTTISVYVKPNGRTKVGFYWGMWYQGTNYTIKFDLSSNTVIPGYTTSYYAGTTLSWEVEDISIEDVGNDWSRLNISISHQNSLSFFQIRLLNDAEQAEYTGDGNSGIYIWGPQYEISPIATPYQRIYTDGSYDETDKTYLKFDLVDDNFALPSGLNGELLVATRDGIVAYGINTDNGEATNNLISTPAAYNPFYTVNGLIYKPGSFTEDEKITAAGYFKKNSRIYNENLSNRRSYNTAYDQNKWMTSMPLVDTSKVNTFYRAWRNCANLSSFPAIDTSRATNLQDAWQQCASLSSFPLIDTSNVTTLSLTWYYCTSLESFPLINTSAVTNMQSAWNSCHSLTSFPLIDTSKVTTMQYTWKDCSSLSSFPAINTSAVSNMDSAWYGCNSLSSFPSIDTGNVTTLYRAWQNCTSLSSFPSIDTGNVTNMGYAWYGCNSLSSFPLIDTSKVVTMNNTWQNCTNLSSFPSIDTGNVTNMGYAWRFCYGLTSFPLIDTSKVTGFGGAWNNCTNLSSFPAIDCRSATSFGQAWDGCGNLEHFPAGVFDNTSGTTDFSAAFRNTKLNTQSIDNVLVSINNANTSNGTLTLNSTNMQPPSYWGIAASGALEDRGWNVTTKTPTTEALTDSTIAPMFFSGDVGAWYDPSDFDTMFEDYGGTIPVTGVGQPVGLILDKSRGLQKGNDLITTSAINGSTYSFDTFVASDTSIVSAVTLTSKVAGAVWDLGQMYPVGTVLTGSIVISIASGSTAPGIVITPQSTGGGGYASNRIYTLVDGVNDLNFTLKVAGRYLEIGGTGVFDFTASNPVIRSVAGNHAYQQTSTARPLLAVDASGKYFLDADGVDDYLEATMPEVIGKKIVASPEGIVEYGVNIPAGSHILLRNNTTTLPNPIHAPHKDNYGEITTTNPFNTDISSTVYQYLTDKGAGPSGVNAFSGVTALYSKWKRLTWLTEFPLIDTSQVTSMYDTWEGCVNLSSFPLIDTSKVTDMSYAFRLCSKLTTIPAFNTSAVLNMYGAFQLNNGLSSFPLIDTRKVTNMQGAWDGCPSLHSFPLLNTSAVTNMSYAWRNCTSLSSFPQIDCKAATSLSNTWASCLSLTSFPQINTIAATSLAYTWQSCFSLSSFPQIDCRSVININYAWHNCTSLEVFPSGVFDNTSGTTNFSTTFLLTKLNSSSMDNVLVSVGNAARTYELSSGTMTLNSTNMQNPTARGLLGADELYDRGWTLDLKGGYTPIDGRVSGIMSSSYGSWIDTFNFDYLYEDSSGTIPVTGVEQPIGLLVDRSGNSLDFSQSTSTARPLLISRENYLDYSQDFDVSSSWVSYNLTTITPSAILAPDGTNTACLMVEDGTNTIHGIKQLLDPEPAGPLTFSVYAKAKERNYLQLGYTTTNAGENYIVYNLSDVSVEGAYPDSGSNTIPILASSIEDVGDGWRRCSITVGDNSRAKVEVKLNLSTSGSFQLHHIGGKNYTGDTSSGLYIWGAQLEQHRSARRYQRVFDTSSYDVTAFSPFLNPDGVDDFIISSPSGVVGEAIIATKLGIAKYSVDIPAGSFRPFNTTTASHHFAKYLNGFFLKSGSFTEDEKLTIYGYLSKFTDAPTDENAYNSLGSLNNLFSNATFITGAFPQLDLTKGTTYTTATFYNCTNVTSFPVMFLAYYCYRTFYNCISASSIEGFGNSRPANLNQTFSYCRSLLDFPYLDTSRCTYFGAVWSNCHSLTSFPALNTSAGTDFSTCWAVCSSLTDFPLIDTGKGTRFVSTWASCFSLSSFPQIDCKAATSLSNTWANCSSLEVFPSGVFDNTSGTTDFSTTFTGCTSLNQQSIDNILVSVNNAGTSNGTITLPGEAPSTTGESAIDSLRSRGWTVTVTGGY